MKLKVDRQLSGGLYHVAFTVSDFTPEELSKMASFGVPTARILLGPPNGRQTYKLLVTQIASQYKASFPTEEEAKKYEQEVVTEVSEGMKSLRARKDDYSSTQEVEL